VGRSQPDGKGTRDRPKCTRLGVLHDQHAHKDVRDLPDLHLSLTSFRRSPSGNPLEGGNARENLIDSYLLTGSYLQTGRGALAVRHLCSALADHPDQLSAESGDGDDD
jgi:hypothetical protein